MATYTIIHTSHRNFADGRGMHIIEARMESDGTGYVWDVTDQRRIEGTMTNVPRAKLDAIIASYDAEDDGRAAVIAALREGA